MRKVNTRGISNANKGMLMAAMAYNLKKYLKFSQKRVQTVAKSAKKHLLQLLTLVSLIFKPNPSFKLQQIVESAQKESPLKRAYMRSNV